MSAARTNFFVAAPRTRPQSNGMRWGIVIPALALAVGSVALPRRAEARGPDHVGAALGGLAGGLICGGGTLVYARLRAGGRESHTDDPMLWHQTEGPAVLGAFFGEHALVGGLTGALGNGPRPGFIIGGAVTCTLDVAWIITSEVIAAGQEPEPTPGGAPAAFLNRDPDAGWRIAPPPIAVARDGAWVSLLAIRF